MLQNGAFVRTAACVQDMMLVQRPPAQTGGIKFIALQNDCPFLPQDETGAGFILITDRHCVKTGWAQKGRLLFRKKKEKKLHNAEREAL